MTRDKVSSNIQLENVLLPDATAASPATSRRIYRAYGTRQESGVVGPTQRRAPTASGQSTQTYAVSRNDDGPLLSAAEARAPERKGRFKRWAEWLLALWQRSALSKTGATASADRIENFKAGLEDSLVGYIAQAMQSGNPDTSWGRNVSHYLDLLDGEKAFAASGDQPPSAAGYEFSEEEFDGIVEKVANRVLGDLNPAEVLVPDAPLLENLRQVIRESGEPRLNLMFEALLNRIFQNAIPDDPAERIQLAKSGLASVLTALAAVGLQGHLPHRELIRPVNHYDRMLGPEGSVVTLSHEDISWLANTVADRLAQDFKLDESDINRLDTFFWQSGYGLLKGTFRHQLSERLKEIMIGGSAVDSAPDEIELREF